MHDLGYFFFLFLIFLDLVTKQLMYFFFRNQCIENYGLFLGFLANFPFLVGFLQLLIIFITIFYFNKNQKKDKLLKQQISMQTFVSLLQTACVVSNFLDRCLNLIIYQNFFVIDFIPLFNTTILFNLADFYFILSIFINFYV